MQVDCTANLELKDAKVKRTVHALPSNLHVICAFFPIFSINISQKISSTNELHHSSENRHLGVGKIVRFLRTLRKICKITSRFKCIEANWALFKMIIFFLIYFLSFLTFFFYLFRFSLFGIIFPCTVSPHNYD